MKQQLNKGLMYCIMTENYHTVVKPQFCKGSQQQTEKSMQSLTEYTMQSTLHCLAYLHSICTAMDFRAPNWYSGD